MRLFQAPLSKSVVGYGGLAVVLIVGGMIAGLLVRERVLAPYIATSAITLSDLCSDPIKCSTLARLEDVQSFRRPEPTLRSQATLERFAAAQGLQDDPAIKDLANQLASGRSTPFQFSVTFPITRNDIKEIPEALAREMFKPRVQPILSVTVSDIDRKEVLRRQLLLLDYCRDTLLRSILTEVSQIVLTDAQILSSQLTTKISDERWKEVSLSRQIKEMENIRTKYMELPSTGTVEQSNLSREMIQIPTNETSFLSPSRQLVGLETQKSQLMETLSKILARQAFTSALENFATWMVRHIEDERDSFKLLNDSMNELEKISTNSTDADTKYAVNEARNKLRETLTLVRARYVDHLPMPLQPLVYRSGPGRLTATFGGGVLGFLVWLAAFRWLNGGLWTRQNAETIDETELQPSPAKPQRRAL